MHMRFEKISTKPALAPKPAPVVHPPERRRNWSWLIVVAAVLVAVFILSLHVTVTIN